MKYSSVNAVIDAVMDVMETRMKSTVTEMDSRIKNDSEFPKDTQDLLAHQHFDVKREPRVIQGRLINDSPYAIYNHEGTGIYASNGQGRKTAWLVKDVRYRGRIQTFWTKGIRPKKFISKHTITQIGLDAIHSILKGGTGQ